MKEKEMEVQKREKEKLVKPREIPGDVMLDIFLRLSAKDLYRFTCVSKDFLKYISSPCFHHLRTGSFFSISLALLDKSEYKRGISARSQILLSVLDDQGQTISKFTQEIQVQNKYAVLLPSNHNLVSIATIDHTYICDPSKQEFMELPYISSDLIYTCALSVGFGYLPSKNEYKILTISNYTSGTSSSIADCCSEWRVLEGGAPQPVVDSHPALVNGSVHWKIHPARDRVSENEQIMCFNLEDEKFWILPVLPACVEEFPRRFNMAVSKEKLWLNHFEYVGQRQVMDMWVLKDSDKFTWVKEYSIDFSILNIKDVAVGTRVLNVRDEELLISISYSEHQVYYNLKTKSFRGLRTEERSSFCFCYYTDVVSFH
ncbi:hypothetical protein PTKIN_Ptkin09bG0280100 [Pterospermum kingtungense]